MRARNIKPGFFINEQLGECSLAARLLFIGLWLIADREGRLEYREKRIKAEVFPYDDVDVSSMVGELVGEGLLVRYAVNGTEYIWVPTFSKHQNPHKNEKESELPACPQDTETTELQQQIEEADTYDSGKGTNDSSNYWSAPVKARTTRADSLFLNPDTGLLIPDTGLLIPELTTSCPELPAADSEPEHERSDVKPVKVNPEKPPGPPPQPEPEPPKSQKPKEPPVMVFPLARKGETFPVTQSDIDEWGESFPGIDLLQELRHCLQWSRDNPTRRKTRAGIRRHITSWLAKAQDRARAPTSASPGQGGQTVRRTASQQYMHEVGELLEAIDAFDENGCGQRVGATAPALPGGGAQRQIDQHTG